MVPALVQLADAQIRPKFNLEGASGWCWSLGDLQAEQAECLGA